MKCIYLKKEKEKRKENKYKHSMKCISHESVPKRTLAAEVFLSARSYFATLTVFKFKDACMPKLLKVMIQGKPFFILFLFF